MRILAAFLSILALSACSGVDHHAYLAQHGVTKPTPKASAIAAATDATKLKPSPSTKSSGAALKNFFR